MKIVFEEHISDTRIAGAGLCREEGDLRARSPERVRELIEIGVAFTRHGAEYDFAP